MLLTCLFKILLEDWTPPSVMLCTKKVHLRTLVPNKARSFLYWPRRWIHRYLGPSRENPGTSSVAKYLHNYDHLHQALDLFLYVNSNQMS